MRLSKAFADKNRVKILQMLSEGPLNVSTVADDLNVEENLASHHLRVLHSLGLLKNTKRGRQVFYSLNKAKMVSLIRDLREVPFFKEVLEEALTKE
ncbi:helix-turn-helix transcriptional regulator [Candidatus Nomurabacteria bacterium]|uniref:Helix-turn-helix transcriptional regulator n=1 Tax=candidate division WWE3 bacterium TaxID=2053526 RepID=A0A955E0D7_UNCKA|nr:helix-turn-helix transcriptional regulator [candidate division WWE3 bacterium]MCB9823600.1 helix-turn-helix transcriptional regulator [Candidatus Nomurabacteria bacterium]MCB9827395.1 helix-turn-helix transcriptional regulator [Candidatus Nomurabacteria bacterium]